MTQSGVAKARLPWADLIIKSFLGGIFIPLGSLFDLVVAGGAPGLRESNPSLITLLAAFTFPIGFVLVILTNIELVTSNIKDNLSKIVGIWIPIWAFVALGYQHSVANFFLVPIGMFYGANFGVGKFIYQSTIPVTLGNIVGGAVMKGAFLWFLYGRDDTLATQTGQLLSGERESRERHVAYSSGSEEETVTTGNHGRSRRDDNMV
nr:hypothetical protein FVER53263_20042 [Fusarium verticillioides]